jgi:tRNA(Arg) A34 adenosine deaminase TadA
MKGAMTMRRSTRLLAVIVALTMGACAGTPYSPAVLPGHDTQIAKCVFPTDCKTVTPPPYTPTPQQEELDNIYTLLAYSVVYVNWQTSAGDASRGYNIGSVLVDPANDVVCWGVNSVNVTQSGTQHGEVRLITNYQANVRRFSLKGYVIYTTLEPCAMCSGMMTLQSVARTIFGQRDPDFGDAIQHLTLNSKSIGGYCPYPRGVISAEAHNAFTARLDQEYCKYYNATSSPSLTDWLASDVAHGIYADAYQQLLKYEVKYPENQHYLDGARQFLASVPTAYTPIPYSQNCSK